MDESGWGDGPQTGPSASGDPHDKEKEELIEEDEAMEEDDDEDEDDDDDESDDEEEEEDASEEEWETLEDDTESTLLEESDDSGDENAETCPICLNRLRDQDIGMPETCDHTFCLECIQEWAKNVNTCPVDRQVFRLILARHPGQDKIFKKFPVEEHNVLEEEEVADEDDVTYCEICNQCDREDKLLLCDGCDLGYHMDCLVPPLRRVPVEEWFCPECEPTSYSQNVAEMIDDFEETSELIAENRDRLMPTRLRATVTQEQPVRHSHRRIPRTLLSERVREAIEETRRRKIRRILSSSEDGEEDTEGSMEEESTTETPSSAAAKKKTVTPKKTTRKRKTTRRKRKGKKRKTTKRRKRKTKTGKRKTGKRRVKKRRRKTVRTVQEWKETVAKSHTPLTVKGRIAGALGLSKPPPGCMIPLQKLPGDKSLDMRRSEVGITSLSIFGSRDQLDPSYEDEDIQQPGSSKEAAESQQQKPHRHSRSALYSHRPIGRIPARLIAKLVSPSEPVESTSASAASVGPIDLLGSIMQEQKVLHMQGKDVTIHRDGSLSTKKPLLENQIPKNKSKDSSEGKELPSLFGNINKKTASNDIVMQSKEYNSNTAGNLSIDAELDIKNKKEINSCLTEEYDPAHPTDDLEELDEIPVQTDHKASLEDEYDPAHPTDDIDEDKVEESKEETLESKDLQVKSDYKGDNSIYGQDVKNIKDEKNSKNTINVNINDPKSKYGKDVKNKSNSIKIKLKTDSKFLSSFNPVESSLYNLEESMIQIETLSDTSVHSTEKDLKGSEETMIDSEKNLLESSESESKQSSCKVSSKEMIDMFADESVEHGRNLIETDVTNKNSGASFTNEEMDRINYNCGDSSVMERSLIGGAAEKASSNEAENLEENDASKGKVSDGNETDGSKDNGDAQESDNLGKVGIIDENNKVGDWENVNENNETAAKEEDEVEDKDTPFIDHRSIAQVLQLLAKSGEEQKKDEEGERESEKDKVSTKRSQERDRRGRHHDRDKSRDRSDNRKHRHRRSRSRDRKSRSRDKRSRSQEKRSRSRDKLSHSQEKRSRSQDKRSRSHDKSKRSRSRDRSRKKRDRNRSRSRDRKRKRNRDRSQERSRSKERSKSNEKDSSRRRRRSKDRDLVTRSDSRHSDEFEKENAYYSRQERQREIKSLMDIDVSAGMKRMRDRTDHSDVDNNEKHRYMDEEATEEERIDQIENIHCSTERSHSPNSDQEIRGRRNENWRSLPENRGFTTSLDSSSPVDNSLEFFEEEERSQESILGPGPSSIHLGNPVIGNCFPPPPPPPPPPTTIIVNQDPEMIQVSGPPGHGLLGEGPLILQGPHPGDSPLFHHRMPLPLGLNVVPPRFHQHLGPHQRHFLFNPFLNRPPISRFHLPGGPPLGWPPQMIPFGARIAPEGIVGPAGLYDSLPSETSLNQPLLPPQSETLSNVMVPTSEAILFPVSLETEGGGMIPSSVPRSHSVLNLPLQPPPPHSAISVTDTIRTSTVITTSAPQLLTTSNVTESSNAPKPGGMISIKLQELSQLLNTQARLASLNKSKDNSVDRNSDRTNKLTEQKEENVFKVPLPPPPSGAKTSTRNNGNSGEVINEVVDMDMSSPVDNEDLIELPETGDLQKKLSEQKINDNEANQAKRKSETKENRHRYHEPSRKKGDKEKGTKDNAEIQKTTAQSESDVTSSAKFVKKLQIQERVVAEVKDAIKPHYSCRRINKDQYKEILRKAVPKICHSANTKNGEVHSEKIKALVNAYVEKFNRKKGEAVDLDSPD